MLYGKSSAFFFEPFIRKADTCLLIHAEQVKELAIPHSRESDVGNAFTAFEKSIVINNARASLVASTRQIGVSSVSAALPRDNRLEPIKKDSRGIAF